MSGGNQQITRELRFSGEDITPSQNVHPHASLAHAPFIMYFQQTVEQKIADLNKKIGSLTKAKVDNDVEQALRNVRKAVARAPESFDPHLALSSLEILVDAAKFGGHKDAQLTGLDTNTYPFTAGE